MSRIDSIGVLEAALLCASAPLTLPELARLFEPAASAAAVQADLLALQRQWSKRGLELVCVADGWRFQSRALMRPYLERMHPEKPPRYSRAVLETLAIIAYRQPVTRGEMEDLRGVSIHSGILRQLEERGWIEVVGQRQSAGRPALYATTARFLSDLGLANLAALPALEPDAPGAPNPAILVEPERP